MYKEFKIKNKKRFYDEFFFLFIILFNLIKTRQYLRKASNSIVNVFSPTRVKFYAKILNKIGVTEALHLFNFIQIF